MKILQINKHHYIKGGADRVYFNTGNLLAENGHEVIHFSTSHPQNTESSFSDYFVPFIENRKNGFTYKVLNSGRYLYNKDASRNLIKLIEDFKPDIAHLHLIYGELSASVLKALRKMRVPVVQTVHDYRLLCPANALLDSQNRICEKCINRRFYQCSLNRCLEDDFFYSSILSMEAYIRKYLIDPISYIDLFIFVSKFSEQKHFEFDRRFESKAVHLYNFTDLHRTKWESDKENYFLFFGRLSKEKGLETLLNVAGKVKANFKIAGDGPLAGKVRRCAANNEHIHFLGYQTGEELKQLISQASYIVVPSEWYENNPMTVLEAYSYGVPVIGARIGGIPEIVIDEKTGFLFTSRDEADLERVILKASRVSLSDYKALSENAISFARQHFSSSNHYLKLMEIYNDVIRNA